MITFVKDTIFHIKAANSDYKIAAKKAIIATLLSAGAVHAPWEATRIIGLTVLAGIGYGIANEMISSYSCSQHFAVQHITDRSTLRNHPIENLHPSLNAMISGMLDYWRISAITGIVFSIIARIPCTLFPARKITFSQLTPYLAIGIATTTLVMQISSRVIQKHYDINQRIICRNRHAISYGILATGNILLGIALITARVGLIKF